MNGYTTNVSARLGRLLGAFADAHGFLYDPFTGPSAATIFRYGDLGTPLGWIGVPGRAGFEVGRHRVETLTAAAETPVATHVWTYAVFTLRHRVSPAFLWPRDLWRRVYPLRVPPDGVENVEPRTVAGLRRYRGYAMEDVADIADVTFLQLFTTRPRWTLEMIGSELFLYTARPLPLTSRRLWRSLDEFRTVLRPHLAQPVRGMSRAVPLHRPGPQQPQYD